MTAAGFRKTFARTGIEAGLPSVHPHMLRHGCGFGLIDRGVDVRTVQAWLGHRDISNTVRYTTVSARRFEGIWGEALAAIRHYTGRLRPPFVFAYVTDTAA